MKIRNVLIALAVTGAAATAFAWPDTPPPPEEPPPPPPPTLNLCSPGFWKNHPEFWQGAGLYCGSAPNSCINGVLTELKSQGPGSGERRHTAAALLNAWADEYYGAVICTE